MDEGIYSVTLNDKILDESFQVEEKIYSIKLSDGTFLVDLRLNGNNFISKTPINSEIFEGNLDTVVISDGEIEETHKNMGLVQITTVGEEYWFILRDVPAAEIENARLRSDLDYVIMMTEIDI